jgi:hypothetical protein
MSHLECYKYGNKTSFFDIFENFIDKKLKIQEFLLTKLKEIKMLKTLNYPKYPYN